MSVCVPVAHGPTSAGVRRRQALGKAIEFVTRNTGPASVPIDLMQRLSNRAAGRGVLSPSSPIQIPGKPCSGRYSYFNSSSSTRNTPSMPRPSPTRSSHARPRAARSWGPPSETTCAVLPCAPSDPAARRAPSDPATRSAPATISSRSPRGFARSFAGHPQPSAPHHAATWAAARPPLPTQPPVALLRTGSRRRRAPARPIGVGALGREREASRRAAPGHDHGIRLAWAAVPALTQRQRQ
jgi:hypothetical protein